ncbi:MAG: hypothetical protein H8D23_22240 [Candidatus Brocadiales bacterium]|nr:hypothetical protein [Candidatus Brocadiales bacterium]
MGNLPSRLVKYLEILTYENSVFWFLVCCRFVLEIAPIGIDKGEGTGGTDLRITIWDLRFANNKGLRTVGINKRDKRQGLKRISNIEQGMLNVED